MADTLNAAGLNTLHDETLNDYPSYTGSYENSRAVVQRYLAQYPSIKVVLDVHRDAIETEGGSRMAPVCTVDGRQAAQVMIICGCDNGGSVRLPGWRQNLRFAAAWGAEHGGDVPRVHPAGAVQLPLYNQDLTTGSLLIEIGATAITSTRPSTPGSWRPTALCRPCLARMLDETAAKCYIY